MPRLFSFLFQTNSEPLKTFYSQQMRCSEPLVMAVGRAQAGQTQTCFIYKDDLILPASMEAPGTF